MRLSTIPVEQWDPDLREAMQAAPMTDTERGVAIVFAHRPDILKALLTFGATLVGNATLSPRLQELIRLRLAWHNQCDLCMLMRYKSAIADGLTEDHVRQLEHPQDAPDFTEAEKAALAYVDLTATDHHRITQATFDDLRRFYSEKEIVELGTFIAFYDGFGRLEAIWDPVELLPPSYRDSSIERAPWRDEHEEVRR
jgi:AhpD family alkylhydroperoxidase